MSEETGWANASECRLLFVTAYPPSRSDLGGASWVDTRVLSAVPDEVKCETITVALGEQDHQVELEVRSDRRATVRTMLRMVLRREPYIVAKFRQSRNWTAAARALRERAQDRVIVTSQWPALLLALDAGLPVDAHIAHNVDYKLSELHDPALFRFFRNAAATRRFEVSAVRRAVQVYCLSRTDSERLASHGIDSHHLDLVSHGWVAREGSPPNSIGFIGKLSWPPNAAALKTLRTEVMPLLRAKMASDAPSLVVAGRGTEKLESGDVEVLGSVDDVSDFYERVGLVVIPRGRQASGVSIKMLEALERGVTVIASPSVISAVEGSAGAIAAESSHEIADAVQSFFLGERAMSGERVLRKNAVSLSHFWASAVGSRSAD